MKTYDEGGSSHGTMSTWRSLKGVLRRWVDRERELISLRNAVGMMSEARRADAAEYHEMVAALRSTREQIALLKSHIERTNEVTR